MLAFLKQFQKKWRDLHLRVEHLEKRAREGERLLEILITREVFRPGDETGMNGQAGRKALVRELFERVPFRAAVETGTYLGQTTGFLASSYPIPVHSCELMPKYHEAARILLRDLPNAHLHCRDARAFLEELSRQLPAEAGPVFFYLDAHWYADLPLEEEIALIASRWHDFVVLIDDFEVPEDPGYDFDRYGDRVLNLGLIAPALQKFGLQAFFPTLPSADETGRRRGCVVLAPSVLADRVRACPSLRPGPPIP